MCAGRVEQVSCSLHQVDDVLNGRVSSVVSRLEFALGPDGRVRPVMKEAVGQGATDPLVKENEEQGNLQALGGQAIGVAAAVALEQAMGSELSQVIAELSEAVALGGQGAGGQHRLMKCGGSPAADGSAAVHEDFE